MDTLNMKLSIVTTILVLLIFQQPSFGLSRKPKMSDVDEIKISHKAFSREGFALGALSASKFVQNKVGVFTMEDLLDLN